MQDDLKRQVASIENLSRAVGASANDAGNAGTATAVADIDTLLQANAARAWQHRFKLGDVLHWKHTPAGRNLSHRCCPAHDGPPL